MPRARAPPMGEAPMRAPPTKVLRRLGPSPRRTRVRPRPRCVRQLRQVRPRPRRVRQAAGSAGSARSSEAAASAAERDTWHGHLERRARPRRFNLVGAGRHVVARDRPSVAPEQRPDVQDAGAAAIEVGLVVHRELLNAVAQVEQAEVAGTDVAAARSGEQLSAALESCRCPCCRGTAP